MISVDTSGQLLQASALHRIALFKMPNTSNSAAWRLELVDDNHGRKELAVTFTPLGDDLFLPMINKIIDSILL